MKECPSCNAKLTSNPTVCPECGASLELEDKYICTYCDNEFFGNKNQCPECGSTKIFKKSEFLNR